MVDAVQHLIGWQERVWLANLSPEAFGTHNALERAPETRRGRPGGGQRSRCAFAGHRRKARS
jgi:hypothetical protein